MKPMKLLGIGAAVVVVGIAYTYNKGKDKDFVLREERTPAKEAALEYRYVKKTRSTTGKKRWAKCYVIRPYKNTKGDTMDVGCVKEREWKAICAAARECRKEKKDDPEIESE